jgi:hypothetical protein
VQSSSGSAVGQTRGGLGPGQHGGRNEHDRHGEQDDVPAGGVAGGEELGVAAEQVEERLREREGRQRREMDAPDDAQPVRTSFTCATPFGSVIQMR